MDAAFWIQQLNLQRHPEGGYFAEVYKSDENVQPGRGERPAGTSIYFLLEHPDFSAFHRLQSDEIWHFYAGVPLTLWVMDAAGSLTTLRLGSNPALNQEFQAIVPKNTWFAAQPDAVGFSLVGCTMAPGFEYADFELARAQELAREYPQHRQLIERLTRGQP